MANYRAIRNSVYQGVSPLQLHPESFPLPSVQPRSRQGSVGISAFSNSFPHSSRGTVEGGSYGVYANAHPNSNVQGGEGKRGSLHSLRFPSVKLEGGGFGLTENGRYTLGDLSYLDDDYKYDDRMYNNSVQAYAPSFDPNLDLNSIQATQLNSALAENLYVNPHHKRKKRSTVKLMAPTIFKPKRPSESSKVSLSTDSSPPVYERESKVQSNSKSSKKQRLKSVLTCNSRQRWTEHEDKQLRDAVKKYGGRNWKLISSEINTGKTHIQCLQRWKQVLQPGLIKGAWSKEEDDRLLHLMQMFGEDVEYKSKHSDHRRGRSKFGQWKKIEQYMNGRTAKQCRERWLLNLDPTINKTEWTKPEDQRLIDLQKEMGNSWSKIKDMLNTNRTENAVKLRYNFLKKQIKRYGVEDVLNHIEYKEETKTLKTEKIWSVEEDKILISGMKYRDLRYNELLRELSSSGIVSNKTEEDVRKRWKYLCFLDQELNDRVPPDMMHECLDVDELAASDIARVRPLAEEVTPDDLKKVAKPVHLNSQESQVGNDITKPERDTDDLFTLAGKLVEESNIPGNSVLADAYLPFDRYDPRRVFDKKKQLEKKRF